MQYQHESYRRSERQTDLSQRRLAKKCIRLSGYICYARATPFLCFMAVCLARLPLSVILSLSLSLCIISPVVCFRESVWVVWLTFAAFSFSFRFVLQFNVHMYHAPERIKFKLAVIVYRGIHGTAPRCLSDLLHRVSDITSRRRLRSSTISELVIPLSRLVTVGDRSFAASVPGSGTLYLRTL